MKQQEVIKKLLKSHPRSMDDIHRKDFMKKNRAFTISLAYLAWVFLALVPRSAFANSAMESLPSGLKANLMIKLPKNTSNLSEGYELAEQSNVAVTLRLLSPNACVLVSETQTRNIVKGSLNVVLGANPLTSESFQSFGNIAGSNKLEKFQQAFSNVAAVTGLTTCYQSLTQFTLHESHNSYTPGPQDTRYLMVELTVTNKASQVIPIKLATSLGVTPYSHLASKARVAESLAQPISNAQLSEEEFSVTKIPSLDASKIVTGVLGLDRIPALDASHVTTGSLTFDRLPSPLNGSGCSDGKILKRQGGAWVCGDESGIGTESDPTVQGFAKQAPSGDDFSFTGGGGLQLKVTGVDPSHSYSKITVDAKGRVTGGSALSASDIPNLDAAKISSGTLSYSQLPPLGITHLKTMMGTPQMDSVGCTANQALSWSSVTDLLTCMDISIAHTQVTGLGSLATASQVNLSSQVTGSLALTSLASSGASANQILRWNGTQWSPSPETAASWSSVTGKPTTLSGYGITDGLSSSLTSAQIRVGNSSNLATAVSLSGDAVLSNTGVLTLGNSGVTTGTYPKVTVDAKGRVTAGTTLEASDIPNLDGAKITTGVVDSARLPVASNTVSGLVNTLAQSFAGVKTFLGNLVVKAGAKLLVTNSSDQVRIELDGATGELLVKNSTGSSNTVTLSGDTGNITTTGGITADRIQLGNSSTVCNTANEGSLRYNAQAKKLEVCTGMGWERTGLGSTQCPSQYIFVPALPPYTTNDFCVAKYEMKNVSGVATSQPAGAPWVSIQRGATETTASSAWKACRDLGANYNLISNAQWQTIARNIQNVAVNWSGGSLGSGALNRGHSDSSPNNALAADASDTNACSGTGDTCSATTWHNQRRTHVLSNGQVLWDFGGNVWEWVRDDYSSLSVNPTISSTWQELSGLSATNQALFGPSVSSYNSTQGMGQIYGGSAGAVLRGGSWSSGAYSGVFTSFLGSSSSGSNTSFGFRCVFVP
jgi:hypothetical protein